MLVPRARAAAGGSTSPARRPDSKHWWVDASTPTTPEELPDRRTARSVLPGRPTTPRSRTRSITRRRGRLARCGCAATRSTEPGHEDRMTTAPPHQRRRPGLDRPRRGARRPRRGSGTRAAPGSARCSPTTRSPCCTTAAPDAESNWFETTGVARWDGDRAWSPTTRARRSPRRTPTAPCATPPPCRCPTAGTRFYVEAARARRRARPRHLRALTPRRLTPSCRRRSRSAGWPRCAARTSRGSRSRASRRSPAR